MSHIMLNQIISRANQGCLAWSTWFGFVSCTADSIEKIAETNHIVNTALTADPARSSSMLEVVNLETHEQTGVLFNTIALKCQCSQQR
jgi:hypothetical protein